MAQQRVISVTSTGSSLPASESKLVRFAGSISAFLRSIKVRRRERTMHLCETLPLGEKRFLAVVEVEKQRFLIAATSQSISLLRCLQPPCHAPHSEPFSGDPESPEGTR